MMTPSSLLIAAFGAMRRTGSVRRLFVLLFCLLAAGQSLVSQAYASSTVAASPDYALVATDLAEDGSASASFDLGDDVEEDIHVAFRGEHSSAPSADRFVAHSPNWLCHHAHVSLRPPISA